MNAFASKKQEPICYYDVWITFYGFDDNDDGEGRYGTSVIAYPSLHHHATEDEGSFVKPSTFATDERLINPGTKIYVPRLMKYYIMEDRCVQCAIDWKKKKKHIDLYIGGNKHGGANLIARQRQLTLDCPEIVIINPPDHLPVNSTLLYKGNV